MKKNLLFAAIVGVSVLAGGRTIAQDRGRLFFTADGILLHSTHLNNFPGVSAAVLRQYGPHWLIGGGLEYSWSPWHDDNGWRLTSLRFLPIYGDARWMPFASHWLDPYLRISIGASYNRYMKVDEFGKGPYQVREGGLFTYGGLGLAMHISQGLSLQSELGSKGFRMSFNNLDVNPHGITGRLGLMVKL